MSTQDSRGGAAGGLRDRRVARVLDREISPVWHDRFARLIVRNLPNLPDILAIDVHCGTGRTTGELLHRLGAGAKILAIDPDEGALELAKTRIRPEWKNRVYFKPGHFDDVTAMADDSYNLVVANLVLGESVDLPSAIGEMIRVSKIGGRILATVPLHGTWDEVEDIFAEILRDAGMTAALRRLEALRAIRPTGPQLGGLLRKLGVESDDYVVEHERFQLLFPSGREFLFAPVIEHGPLQLWKAVIGKDGAPQELFWRLKEAIDAYYSGHVLAVTVHAGLVHVEVAKGTARPGPRLAARFWRHYPELDKLWGGLAVGYTKVSDPILPFSDADVSDFDLDIDIDESDPRRRTGALKALRQTGRQPAVETPSPEEFGLRFRPREGSESSDQRPVDAETSGTRARTPASEASGLRALSKLRDESETSGTRAAPRPASVEEDDFSELNQAEPASKARQTPAPAEDDFSGLAEPAPRPAPEPEDGFSRFRKFTRAPADAPAEPAPVEAAPPEDDFSGLGEKPAPKDISEPAPPEDDFSGLNEPEPARTPARRAVEAARPTAEAPREPRPTLRAETRPTEVRTARTAEARPTDEAHPQRVAEVRPTEEARPTEETRPTAEEPRPEPRRPIFARPAEPRPAEPRPAEPRPAEPRESAPEPSSRRPLVDLKPSLPSFRLPEPRPPAETGGLFRPPSFKPPPSAAEEKEAPRPFRPPAAADEPEEPGKQAPRPFRPPAAPAAGDEPEELIDDVEPVEELEPVEEPPVSAPKPPPPKPAPPPLGFKPRPLAPIVPPSDKKK